MMDGFGLYIILGFAAIALYLSREMISNGLYAACKYWRECAFLLLCAAIGGGFAVKKDDVGQEMMYIYTSLHDPAAVNVAATIATCKEFVQAKQNGTEFLPPQTRGMMQFKPDNYWEICVRAFGMNYWKHDISIAGQNGGVALCAAYRGETKRSSKVTSWCETVFASDRAEKAKHIM